MNDEERAAFQEAINAAETMGDLSAITGRLLGVGARELEKVADGLEPSDRIEAARIRAEAASYGQTEPQP